MNNLNTSYVLWLGWFFGVAGFHRIYNKKFFSGFLWLCTWGLFGIGQFIDLLLIPSMVDEHNLRVRQRLGLSAIGTPLGYGAAQSTLQEPLFNRLEIFDPQQLMVQLARVAQQRGGKLSVTQAVIDTGASFEQVQDTLNNMVKKGYIGITNHPDTGVVIYDFLEL